MTDIKQVIQELREAAERIQAEWEGGADLDPDWITELLNGVSALTALESAVEGGTVDIEKRIEAAAEEIDAQWIRLAGSDDTKADITAIIRRHLEVK